MKDKDIDGRKEKAVLISIRPEWCEKIASGEKTIEVRKTRPNLRTPFRAYIYCSQGRDARRLRGSRGKVIGEFVCDKLDWITRIGFTGGPIQSRYSICSHNNMDVLPIDGLLHAARLTYLDLADYLDGSNGYGWHISNLLIYDEPHELTEFRRARQRACGTERCHVRRPPQSWCYVEMQMLSGG